MKGEQPDLKKLEPIVDLALKEDIGSGDITTNALISKTSVTKAQMVAKSGGVIAGLPVAELVFHRLDKKLKFEKRVKDGSNVTPGTVIAEMEGSFRAILTGERTALNFLQRASGIATETFKMTEVIKGLNVKILDTRKTVPGLRSLDKYAVKMGGGQNHRIGLFDMVMLKENHIRVAGGIQNAVDQVRKKISKNMKIEVETTNLDEVKEALRAGADIIMLDNMSPEQMKEAVQLIDHSALVEASGSVTFEKLRDVAETGVDYISIGALTHSVRALDISQYIEIG
jgi:nicotinate-nucleotide pyrophosphorylase (carboxylating)